MVYGILKPPAPPPSPPRGWPPAAGSTPPRPPACAAALARSAGFIPLGLLQVAQRLVQQALRTGAAHGLAADHLHAMLHQNPTHHLHFGGMRGVEQQLDFGLLAAAEERARGQVREPLGNHHCHCRLAAAHAFARLGQRPGGDVQRGVGRHRRHHLAGNVAIVLIDDGHLDFRSGLVLRRAAEDVAEESGDGDGRHEAHDDRAAIHEEEAQIALHQCSEMPGSSCVAYAPSS